MPLRWEILHDRKLVRVVAEGAVTLKEMAEHFDALAVADVLRYPKLFVANDAEPAFTDNDVLMLGARLSAYTATMPSGPLAVVSTGPTVEGTFRRFVNMSPSKRPARLFKTEAEALLWLAAVGDQVADQRSDKYFS